MTSDHSPVFATFEAGVTSQFVSKNGKQWAALAFLAFLTDKGPSAFILWLQLPLVRVRNRPILPTGPQSAYLVSSCPGHVTISVQKTYFCNSFWRSYKRVVVNRCLPRYGLPNTKEGSGLGIHG